MIEQERLHERLSNFDMEICYHENGVFFATSQVEPVSVGDFPC